MTLSEPKVESDPGIPLDRADPVPLNWSLPHHGAALADCGTWIYFGHSAGAETHYRRAKRDCLRFDCPTCRGWEARQAGSICDRLARAAENRCVSVLIRRGRGREARWVPVFRRETPKAIHVVVSAPTGTAFGTDREYASMRTAAYRAARTRGVTGGAAIFHGLRIPSRWNERETCQEGPHFHMLAFGWLDLEAVKEGYARDGWVVRGLGVRKSVRSTALYQLSHASRGSPAPEGNPAYAQPNRGPEVTTWFGDVSYRSVPREEMPPTPEKCPVCGVEVPREGWFRLTWQGSGPPPEDPAGVCDPHDWQTLDRTEWSRPVRVSLVI